MATSELMPPPPDVPMEAPVAKCDDPLDVPSPVEKPPPVAVAAAVVPARLPVPPVEEDDEDEDQDPDIVSPPAFVTSGPFRHFRVEHFPGKMPPTAEELLKRFRANLPNQRVLDAALIGDVLGKPYTNTDRPRHLDRLSGFIWIYDETKKLRHSPMHLLFRNCATGFDTSARLIMDNLSVVNSKKVKWVARLVRFKEGSQMGKLINVHYAVEPDQYIWYVIALSPEEIAAKKAAAEKAEEERKAAIAARTKPKATPKPVEEEEEEEEEEHSDGSQGDFFFPDTHQPRKKEPEKAKKTKKKQPESDSEEQSAPKKAKIVGPIDGYVKSGTARILTPPNGEKKRPKRFDKNKYLDLEAAVDNDYEEEVDDDDYEYDDGFTVRPGEEEDSGEETEERTPKKKEKTKEKKKKKKRKIRAVESSEEEEEEEEAEEEEDDEEEEPPPKKKKKVAKKPEKEPPPSPPPKPKKAAKPKPITEPVAMDQATRTAFDEWYRANPEFQIGYNEGNPVAEWMRMAGNWMRSSSCHLFEWLNAFKDREDELDADTIAKITIVFNDKIKSKYPALPAEQLNVVATIPGQLATLLKIYWHK